MKRLIVALVVGGMLFAGAWAAACALNVDAGVLQAGSDEVLKCDTDGVQVYFRSGAGPGISWDETANDFIVTAVVVGGVNDKCDGVTLEVELTDCHGDGIANGSVTVVTPIPPNPNPVVTLDNPVPASAVCDAHVLMQD
jgi:hypothetical protein